MHTELTGHSEVNSAVSWMRMGAADLSIPWKPNLAKYLSAVVVSS
jgi:FixJ family two-component response regulator